jgi:hypothetical protein
MFAKNPESCYNTTVEGHIKSSMRSNRMAEKDMSEKTLEELNDVFADIVNTLLFEGEEE